MQTDLGYLDGESSISHLERAQADGNLDFVTASMPRLEHLIASYQDRIYSLAQLQYRAQMVRRLHEPRSENRR